MANGNCRSCTASMQASFHIERAWRMLNAAHEIHNLSGRIYRNSLAVAMRSLSDAALALQNHKVREMNHG